MYFKDGWIKVSIGLAQGKKLHDKRETMKRRDDERQMARVMKQY
jgi:SsrA-binding protein